MSRRRLWRYASALLAALALAPAHAAPPLPTATAGARETLVLAASVDGRASDAPVRVERRGSEVWVAAEDLRALGLPMPGSGAVALSTLPGVRYAVDDAEQTLAIETGARGTRLSMAAGPRTEERATANGWGAVVNYDITATADRGGAGVAGLVDAIAFAPGGYGYAGAVVTAAAHHRVSVRRTDIGYTVAAPARLLSATAGDFVTAASSNSRPVRMAGVRIGTDFALRPDLVTFPLPTLAGSAAVPTAVDLIVDGARQPAGEVRAGPFAVGDIPVPTGVNTVSVATRDALGRTVLQTVSTYTSRALLRPGLTEWSVETGWVRTGYLTPADRYRRYAASATMRRGVSDRLTVEAHGEGARGAGAGGVGASLGLGRLGLIDLAASGSAAGGRQLAIGYERVARPVTVTARYLRNDGNWTDLASRYGATQRRHELVLDIGFDLARLGTFNAGLIALGSGRIRYDVRGGRLAGGDGRVAASTLVNASYSARVAERINLLATVAVDARRRRSGFVSIGALLVLGRRSSGFAGITREQGRTAATASIVQSPVEQGQWAFRAAAAAGPVERAGAAVGYLGHAGYVEAAVDAVAGQARGQLSARGSVGIADRHPFAADTMTGSFAVIDAGGQAHLPIYQDNRRIGETDAHGFLVAPNLAAYEPATFAIDPVTVDAALSVGRTEATVRPARRAGVTVSFGLAPEARRSFTVVGDDGVALAPGAWATLGGEQLPIGIGGLLFAPVADRPVSVAIGGPGKAGCRVLLPDRAHADRAAAQVLPCRSAAPGRRDRPT